MTCKTRQMMSGLAASFLLSTALSFSAQTSPAGALYADRLTLRAADEACTLLNVPERAILDGLIDRSRDDAIRAGDDVDRLNTFEASYSRAPRDCDSPILSGLVDLHRLRVTDLAATGQIDFLGVHQSWNSTRAQFTAASWAVSQAMARQYWAWSPTKAN